MPKVRRRPVVKLGIHEDCLGAGIAGAAGAHEGLQMGTVMEAMPEKCVGEVHW